MILENLLSGFTVLFDVWILAAALSGLLIGVIVGAIPGLTATMTIATLVPFTFFLPPMISLGFLLGVYKGAVYGGSIPAILLNTPGTAAAAATSLDGHQLARKGFAKKALQMSLVGSVMGDLLATVVLIAVAAPLASIAIKFSSPEYTLLFLFSLTLIATVGGRSIPKGLCSALLGALVGCIGMEPATGAQRYVFEVSELLGGIPLVPLLIGMFALSEVLQRIGEPLSTTIEGIGKLKQGEPVTFAEIKANLKNIFRSSCLGTAIGALPGLGAEIACWVAYGIARKRSKEPEKFGTGSLEGVAAAESSNNATVPSTLIPMLVFGIPGDVVTAVLLGAFIAQGLTPGPLLFVNHGALIYSLFALLIVTNIALIFIGLFAIRGFSRLTELPQPYVFSCVLVLCVAGAFAINSDFFDVTIMFLGGLLGYLMRRTGLPIPAFIIAVLLSPSLESNLRQTLTMSDGSLAIFVQRPISLTLLSLFGLAFFIIFFKKAIIRKT
jgi:putative tricarboxylic transport membrane protein